MQLNNDLVSRSCFRNYLYNNSLLSCSEKVSTKENQSSTLENPNTQSLHNYKNATILNTKVNKAEEFVILNKSSNRVSYIESPIGKPSCVPLHNKAHIALKASQAKTSKPYVDKTEKYIASMAQEVQSVMRKFLTDLNNHLQSTINPHLKAVLIAGKEPPAKCKSKDIRKSTEQFVHHQFGYAGDIGFTVVNQPVPRKQAADLCVEIGKFISAQPEKYGSLRWGEEGYDKCHIRYFDPQYTPIIANLKLSV